MNIKIGGNNYDVDSITFDYDNGSVEFPINSFLCRLDEIKKLIRANDLIKRNAIRIREVIFSGPATIVFWEDGDKTVVKCMNGDPLNYEMGIAMCTLKKLFGEEGYRNYKKRVKELLPEEKEVENDEPEKT